MSLTFTVSPQQLDLGHSAQVEIIIEAQQGTTVEMGDYRLALREGDRAFEYRIVRSDRKKAVPIRDGKLQWTYRYELDFFLPGSYELPIPIVAFFAGQADYTSSEPEPYVSEKKFPTELSELMTEPITVVVRDPSAASLTQQELENITPLDPIELPRPWSRWWWLGPLMAAALIVLLVIYVRKIRRRRLARLAAPIPADVWAYREFAALIADALLTKGRIQEFYYRISNIVRGYIERRFNVHAPEMTTEEFLETAKNDQRFDQDHTQELTRFLDVCDLVKYAKQIPVRREADQTIMAAKRFIETTRERVINHDQSKRKSKNTPTSSTGQECAA